MIAPVHAVPKRRHAPASAQPTWRAEEAAARTEAASAVIRRRFAERLLIYVKRSSVWRNRMAECPVRPEFSRCIAAWRRSAGFLREAAIGP
jgi:hypothetical protein